jgi:hypothetical protein
VKPTKWVRSEVLLLAILVKGAFFFSKVQIYARDHESTNPGRQVARASAIFTSAPYTYGVSVWSFLYATQATGAQNFVEALRFL